MRVPGFGDRSTKVDTVTGETIRSGETVIRPGETLRAGDTVRTTTVHDTHPTHTHTTAPAGVVGGITAQELQKETHNAYERGRKDERAARKNNPILAIIVVLLAVLGLALAILAAMGGSFRAGGERFDDFLGGLRGEAREVGLEAQDAAGEAAQDLGANIQERGAEAERSAETAPR